MVYWIRTVSRRFNNVKGHDVAKTIGATEKTAADAGEEDEEGVEKIARKRGDVKARSVTIIVLIISRLKKSSSI